MLEQQLLALSVEKKIGQLFFVGIGGAAFDDDAKRLLAEISPGGVCLFARNIKTAEQTYTLLADIRQNCEIELFLSLDEEGGTVDRLRRIVTPLPAASSIKNTEQARKLASVTAEIIRMLGFNMNFAPVVDVVDESRAGFSNGLYTRALGKSKEESAEFAGAYLTALQSENIIGCLKHFPGLGASAVDSHEELPLVDLTETELYATDLFPYIELFKTAEIRAVMISHAAFPHIEWQERGANGKFTPASLSYNFTTKLLREQLGFDGLAITDDLEMGAILNDYGIGEACKFAVKAGEDLLAICAGAENVRTGFRAVLEAVRSGEISETRIDESLRRIARVKNLFQKTVSFNAERLQSLSDEIALFKQEIETR